MRVRGELDERLRRGAEQDIVWGFLVAVNERPQRLGEDKDDVKENTGSNSRRRSYSQASVSR
jgi:hypothetical protein